MSEARGIFVHGVGAVSPAGWGVAPLRDAICKGEPLPIQELARPGWSRPLRVRQVPAPTTRPAFLSHARLRRASPITQYAVAAAVEALGEDAAKVGGGALRLGLVLCVMTGCVNYSRRFYDETLKDPATASPLVFPETVFNAPASHLAALLATSAINYTLVGDPGTFLQGLALAANWLLDNRVDGCLVVGAEEIDWLTSDAYRLFARKIILSDGAGAVYLRPAVKGWDPPPVIKKGSANPDGAPERATPGGSQEENRRSDAPGKVPSWEGSGVASPASLGPGEVSSAVPLHSITDAHLFLDKNSRALAVKGMRSELPEGGKAELLCDGTQGLSHVDAVEAAAWADWPGARLSPKTILGEGLAAASAWQCVTAIDALRQGRHPAASVSVVGCNQQAIGARFARADS